MIQEDQDFQRPFPSSKHHGGQDYKFSPINYNQKLNLESPSSLNQFQNHKFTISPHSGFRRLNNDSGKSGRNTFEKFKDNEHLE